MTNLLNIVEDLRAHIVQHHLFITLHPQDCFSSIDR